MKLINCSVICAALLAALVSVSHAATLNLRETGAEGDGKTDDTAAMQKALNMLKKDKYSKLIIPAGLLPSGPMVPNLSRLTTCILALH